MNTIIYLQNGLNYTGRRIAEVEKTTIAEADPKWETPYLAFMDGTPILRKDWDQVLPEGSSLAFIDADSIPQGGGGGGSNPLRTVLMIAVMIYAAPLAASLSYAMGGGVVLGSVGGLAAMQAGVMMVGMALVNAVVPVPQPPSPQVAASMSAASPTYNIQAQANASRVGGAIPEHFGRSICFPDLASQPYAEFSGNEQYLYQMLCIGRGEYELEPLKIEDSLASSYDEVEYHQYNPNTHIDSTFSAVSNSGEVSGQELTTTFSGPFTINNAGTTINKVGVDLVATNGLFYANDDGSLASKSVTVEFIVTQINDQGVVIGTPISSSNLVFTANTNTPQRYSTYLNVPTGRYQIKIRRVDTKDISTRTGHTMVWAGARGYHPDSTANYGDTTIVTVKMRASNNLSSQSSRKLNIVATRKLPIWNGTSWSVNTATRNPVWAFVYIAKQAGLLDAQLDLPMLKTLAATLDSRGDYFDGRFDNFLGLWEALSKVLNIVRSKPFMQGGMLRVVRDAAQTIPVALFSTRNIVKNSLTIDYLMPNEDTADNIDITYFDNTLWMPQTINTFVSGSLKTVNAKVDLFGVTDRAQAYREGTYQCAASKYRRKIIKFHTEMEGFIPSYGDLIAIQHDMPGWGQGGEVVNIVGNTLTLSEEPVFTTGNHYISLRKRDGSIQGPYLVVAGGTLRTVVFTGTLTDAPYLGLNEERTHYAFGAAEAWRQSAIVLSAKPINTNTVEIEAVNEDPGVHISDQTYSPVAIQFSSLASYTNAPAIGKVTAKYKYIGDRQVILSWQPVPYAVDYVLEQSGGNNVWESDGSTYTCTAQRIARFGSLTKFRVAAVNVARGPWYETTPTPADDVGFNIPSYEISPSVFVTVGGERYQFQDIVKDVGSVRAIRIDVTPPPTPTAFIATAAISSIIITQDTPLYVQGHGHGSTVLYGTIKKAADPIPTFTVDTKKLTEFYGTVTSYATEPSTTWYLWTKWRSADGIESVLPSPVSIVTTGQDVSLLLTALSGEITSSELNTSLGNRINLIDGGVTQPTLAYPLTKIAALQDGLNQQVRRDLDDTASQLLEAVTLISTTQTTFRDAGVYTDSADGVVKIYGLEAAKDHLNTVDIALNAQAAQIALKASTTYVNNAISAAVIDPSQVPVFGALEARVTTAEAGINGLTGSVSLKANNTDLSNTNVRVTTAESDINALEGQIALRVTSSDFTAVTGGLDGRIGSAETTLTALGDTTAITSIISQGASQYRDNNATAETILKNILNGDAAATAQSQSIATARQDLTAYSDAGVSAEAAQRLLLAATVDTNSAAIKEETLARASADSAEASARVELAARVTTAEGGLAANAASIISEASTRVTQTGAIAARATNLEAAISDIGVTLVTKASISYVDTAKADAIGSAASTTALIQARLDTGDYAAVKTESSTNASAVVGLKAQYTVKVDTNGYVSGFGLANTLNNATPYSEFIIRADNFSIAPVATDNTAVDGSPFFYRTTATIINGANIPAGAYMKSAYIHDASITNAKIANLAVDSAKIADLSADKITAGVLQVGSWITSSGYVTGSTGWAINANGGSEFSNVTVRGGVYATSGQIGGISIASNALYSGQTAYNTGVGFYLGSNGTFSIGNPQANSLTWDGISLNINGGGNFSGDISAATGTFKGSISGSQFTTGAYTGDAWPAINNYGTYLGPGGLLIGNANNGKYFQVTADGNLYSPGFKVENGAMTISQANVINTLNIGTEQVTVLRAAVSNSPLDIGAYGTVLALPAMYVPTGSVYLSWTITGDANWLNSVVVYRVLRNGIALTGWMYTFTSDSWSLIDTPGGSATYTIQNYESVYLRQSFVFGRRTMSAIGCMK